MCDESPLVQYTIENNLAAFLNTLNSNVDEQLSKLKSKKISFLFDFFLRTIFLSFWDLKSSLREKYHSQIEFYRDEVDVRVESLKLELDLLRDDFNTRLDSAKKEIDT
jgi:hypothetical protein